MPNIWKNYFIDIKYCSIFRITNSFIWKVSFYRRGSWFHLHLSLNFYYFYNAFNFHLIYGFEVFVIGFCIFCGRLCSLLSLCILYWTFMHNTKGWQAKRSIKTRNFSIAFPPFIPRTHLLFLNSSTRQTILHIHLF